MKHPTWTDAQRPILRPWIRFTEVWGNVVTRIETQQQRNTPQCSSGKSGQMDSWMDGQTAS